jgi:single-strand DNA-binding protein
MSLPALNLSVVAGTLSSPPSAKTLPSGDRVVSLEVTIRPPAGRAESVPVSWFAAPAGSETWGAGEEVLVVGRVRRRFFRAGGTTASRTEVVADTVVPARQRARVRRALARASAALVES